MFRFLQRPAGHTKLVIFPFVLHKTSVIVPADLPDLIVRRRQRVEALSVELAAKEKQHFFRIVGAHQALRRQLNTVVRIEAGSEIVVIAGALLKHRREKPQDTRRRHFCKSHRNSQKG